MKTTINIVKPFLPDMHEIFHDFKECLDSGMVTNNSKNVVRLEENLQNYFKSKLKPLLFCNGEMALFNVIQSHKLKMGYGPHDSFNVLVPSLTFSGTINAILMNNLKPVFCDVNDTLTIDLNKAKFDDVKMIVLVGAYGNLPDLDVLSGIVNEHKLDVVFDNAPAFGSTYNGKFVSNYGYSEIFSFHASKMFTTMEGGAAVTNDDEIWNTLYKLRDFGQYEKVRGNVDVPGLNSKMQEISALIGLKNLEKIDLILDKRRENIKRYIDFFEGIKENKFDTMTVQDNVFCSYLYYPIILNEEATDFVNYMQDNGVIVRRYYTAVHELDLYNGKYKTQDLSFTNNIKDRLVALPIHTIMSETEINYLFGIVKKGFKMRKVLLSGAGGYIGTVMVKELLNTGHEVIALDRYFFGEDKIHNFKCNKLTLLKDDIRYFDETLLKDVDIVIDLAGLSNDATAEINPVFTKEINCDGSIRLAELAKRYNVTQCIYSSSASVYGAGGKKALQETDKLNPLTDYSKSKVIVEDRLKELQDDKFHITLLRNSTVYGLSPRMRFDLAVNIMTYRAWKEGIIYVMGDGLQWRPFVHVRDVVKAFLLAIDNKKAYGETFNVGSNEQNYTLKDLAATISRYTKDTKVTFIPNSPDHRTYNVNFDKISNVLGFKPSFTIKDGVLEIEQALIDGTLVDNDPTHHTLKWYQTLIKYNKIIEGVKKYDRIL